MEHGTQKRALRLEQEAESAGDAFTVSFTSLSIILLAFFIFLNSLALPDEERERRVLEEVTRNFALGTKRKAVFEFQPHKQADIPIPELASGFPKLTFPSKYGRVADLAESESLEVKRTPDSFIITIPGAELFESGNDEIRAEFLPTLTTFAEGIKNEPLSIEIEGHTDDRPISTQRFNSNWELSVARAIAVLRFFLDKGIAAERLAAAGLSKYHPVASNDEELGRAKNRRVVLVLKEQKEQS